MKEKKDPTALEAFFFFLSVTCPFPFTYKRESMTLQEERQLTSTGLNKLSKAQLHSIFSPETWELLPLLSICNPYYKLVSVTQATADWT